MWDSSNTKTAILLYKQMFPNPECRCVCRKCSSKRLRRGSSCLREDRNGRLAKRCDKAIGIIRRTRLSVGWKSNISARFGLKAVVVSHDEKWSCDNALVSTGERFLGCCWTRGGTTEHRSQLASELRVLRNLPPKLFSQIDHRQERSQTTKDENRCELYFARRFNCW